MNLKKHALHLAVTAGMVGSMVAVAAPAAHAATALPDVCATYLQGTIDPAGGPLPAGIIPLVPPSTSQTYGVAGHLSKGQDKEIMTLNNAAAAGTRASLNLVVGGTITGNTAATGPVAPILTAVHGGTPPAGGTTNIKIAWKNDKATGTPLFATVQVAEGDTAHEKAPVAKGVVNGSTGTDKLGVQEGNVQHGVASLQDEIDRIVIPQSATSGTYTLTMSFPNIAAAGPLAGVTLTSNAIAYNANAAAIASAINTAPGWAGVVGPTAAVAANTNPGDFSITFNGAFTDQSLPSLTVASQTGTLPTSLLDDGSVWNGTRTGGVDPGIAPVSDLGNGIIASTGIMSSGPAGGVTNPLTLKTANTGKSSFYPDTQYTFIQYPAGLVTAINPNLATNGALPILAAITGLPAPALTDNCSLAGLLVIFCTEDAAVIPAAFSGLCATIVNPLA